MLRFNITEKRFEKLQISDMLQENILERYDFQAAIVNSWEGVREELSLPTAYLIGQEVKVHHSVENAIDLLAYDPEDSSLIIIELKRSRNKLQLLQALSYAAMVATWDKGLLITRIQSEINPEPNELIDFINNNPLNANIRIILVAEAFDPEVIITADWLNRSYGHDITVMAVGMHKNGSEVIVHFDQRIPLREIEDVYERRSQRQTIAVNQSGVTWEEQIPKLDYSFAGDAVRTLTSVREGEPARKRIVGIRTKWDGFDRINIRFPKHYLIVTADGKPSGAEEIIQSKFKTPVNITEGQHFHSFRIETETQFQDLLSWLGIQSNSSS